MPINPESIRHPAHPVAKTYVPPGGVAHTVVTGESWTTLAQSVQMSPWDLIRYNYPGLPPDPQAAAREVNWYLQEYVGCTQLTQNRRNYEFHTGDTPGEIWLPSAPVPPSPDEAARKAVLAALRDPAVARMGFGVGFVLIFPRDYERVARAIESGAITVHADPSLGPHQANYNYQSNCFNVPPGISDLPLLIHEATHAIFDIRRIATGTGESEGMAYIAQALFSRVKYGPQGRYIPSMDQIPISWFGWQTIFDESSALAEILIETSYIARDRAKRLFDAVGITTTYINQGPNANYDGVPGA